MGRIVFLGVVAAVAVGMVLASLVRMAGDAESAPGRGGGRGGFGDMTPVRVAPVIELEFADRVEALGTARATESVTITSRVTDVIGRIAFESGDLVAEGDVLAELVDVEEAADLGEARATLTEARAELVRQRDLTSRGVASKSRLDEAQANVSRAEARVRAIEARLADRIVRAPFAGVVGLRDTSEGALVRPGDPIATLDDVSQIKVDFTVPEQYLGALQVGQRVEIRASAMLDEVFTADVESVDTRVDPVTRTATVRARVDNAETRLLPGMLMLVDVTRNQKMSPAVPAISVQRSGTDSWVFTVSSAGEGPIAVRRPVVTGRRSGVMIEITDGLALGESVVSEGVHRVRPDGPVRVLADEPLLDEARGSGTRGPGAAAPAGAGGSGRGVPVGASGGRP